MSEPLPQFVGLFGGEPVGRLLALQLGHPGLDPQGPNPVHRFDQRRRELFRPAGQIASGKVGQERPFRPVAPVFEHDSCRNLGPGAAEINQLDQKIHPFQLTRAFEPGAVHVCSQLRMLDENGNRVLYWS